MNTERRASTIRPYSGEGGVIRRAFGQQLCHFLESSYPEWARWREAFELNAVVHAYAEGVSGGFVDTRTLTMAVLGEYLATTAIGVFDQRARLVSKQLGTKVREAIRPVGASVLSREGTAAGVDKAIIERAVETLNRRLAHILDPTLRDKLAMASRLLGAGLPDEEIEHFVDVRNDLAHDMKLNPGRGADLHLQGRRVRYVVDRLMLGLLKYSGPFVDRRTGALSEFPG